MSDNRLQPQDPRGSGKWSARLPGWHSTGRLGRRGSVAAPRQKRNFSATLRQWHQRAGMFAFLFMAWLGCSGVLINQSASWGYDTARVDWGWVMALYGLRAEPPQSGFADGGHWLATAGDHVLVDARPLEGPLFQPQGFAVTRVHRGAERLVLATPESLVVLNAEGRRIDELSAPILPVSTVRRLGTVRGAPDRLAVQDLDAFQSGDGGESWQPVSPADVIWSTPEPLPAEQRQRLMPHARPSVSLEHVLVDAHSGRLFGSVGAWIINAVGFAAMLLAVSGVWMMWRTSRRRRA